MFDKLRKPTKERSFKKIFILILFGLICFSFVFMGITPDRSLFREGGVIASVNDSVITVAEFRRMVDEYERFMRSNSDLPAAQRQQQTMKLRQEIVSALVDQQVLVQAARRNGFYAPDAAIREKIVSIPFLQEEGLFSRSRYDQYLAYTQSTAAEFESRIRNQVINDQLRQAFFRALPNTQPLMSLESMAKGVQLQLKVIQLGADQLKPEELSQLESALEKTAGLEVLLNRMKLKWTDSGRFDLTQRGFVPNIGDFPVLLDTAVQMKPGEIHPKLLRSGQNIFVLKLVDLKMSQNDKNEVSDIFSAAPSEVLASWLKSHKEKAKIRVNSALL